MPSKSIERQKKNFKGVPNQDLQSFLTTKTIG